MTPAETTILSDYGRPITYFGIAYTLTQEDNDKLSTVDEAVQSRLGDIIYFAPDGSRHITIMNLTHVAEGYEDKDTMQFWKENGALYDDRLKTIVSNLDPFETTFTHLQAGAGAVILRGQDQGQISGIRDQLMDLPRLGGRIIDPDFIHSTQARYKQQVSVSKVREQLKDIEVHVSITIDKIGLVRANVSFSEPHVVLAEYKLIGQPTTELQVPRLL